MQEIDVRAHLHSLVDKLCDKSEHVDWDSRVELRRLEHNGTVYHRPTGDHSLTIRWKEPTNGD